MGIEKSEQEGRLPSNRASVESVRLLCISPKVGISHPQLFNGMARIEGEITLQRHHSDIIGYQYDYIMIFPCNLKVLTYFFDF